MTRILSMNHIVVSHLKTPTIRNKPRDAIDDHLIHYEFKKKKNKTKLMWWFSLKMPLT
jgi:hypothetical protein